MRKKKQQSKLNVMVCLPCNEMPINEKFILVKASDGERSQFIKFGRDTSMKTIMSRLPCIFMDRVYDERRSKRKKAVSA